MFLSCCSFSDLTVSTYESRLQDFYIAFIKRVKGFEQYKQTVCQYFSLFNQVISQLVSPIIGSCTISNNYMFGEMSVTDMSYVIKQ